MLALSSPASAGAPPGGSKTPSRAVVPSPPPAPVRVWLVTPTANGPWTLRIDNTGDHTVRIPADVRLLRLTLSSSNGRRTLHTVRCDAGALRPGIFPEPRALFLPPGQSWIDTFDPHLICFGKAADLLAGSVTVHATFGWDPPPKYSKRAPAAPFAADGVDDPAFYSPLPELPVPTVVLSYEETPRAPVWPVEPAPAAHAASASAPQDAPPPIPAPPVPPETPSAGSTDVPPPAAAPPHVTDANAPRLELTQRVLSDAVSAGQVTMTATAKNVGHRPLLAPLHARMLELRVLTPDGQRIRCDAEPPTHAIARELYRTMKPGASESFRLRLLEACPAATFDRPGIYHVYAVLHAREPGTELGLVAYTGVAHGVEATKLRVQSGPLPFYVSPPAAVPTPPAPSAETTAAQ